MSNTLTNEAHQRSLKDFLSLYNTITDYCFNKCISKFNERLASGDECTCVDTCAENYIQYNQRFMFTFVEHQERRKRDAEQAAASAAAKERETQQQQLQQAAAAFVEGQQNIVSSSPIPADLPLKTGQATELLESLSAEKTPVSLDPEALSKLGSMLQTSSAQANQDSKFQSLGSKDQAGLSSFSSIGTDDMKKSTSADNSSVS